MKSMANSADNLAAHSAAHLAANLAVHLTGNQTVNPAANGSQSALSGQLRASMIATERRPRDSPDLALDWIQREGFGYSENNAN